MSAPQSFGWLSIFRLGLVQTALGSIVVLTTSTINRVMVVEYALPAMLPGVLVGLHYAIQLARPRFGYGSDVGGRSTPWIVGGMAILAIGGIGAAIATAWMATNSFAGIGLALVAFGFIGVGVGASGTSLLALLARRVDEQRRAAAATIVWVMMIAGFVVTAGAAGHFLDPFSPLRLIVVASVVACVAFLVTLVAVYNIEAAERSTEPAAQIPVAKVPFREALRDVWSEPRARQFTIFVFVSMLAYSAQDLILEPFAGSLFGYTPGQSTQLSGTQNAGVLLGMILVGLAGSATVAGRWGSMRVWSIAGCVASAASLLGLSIAAFHAPHWPLAASVFALGLSNGAFAVAAIGSMMALAGVGRTQREGVRMGVWGAAQAVAFGLGGFLGTVAIDVARVLLESPGSAYAAVFAGEGLLFLAAGVLAAHINYASSANRGVRVPIFQRFATPNAGGDRS
jgi:MFS transporter, BCD family, chlorophyll transporter